MRAHSRSVAPAGVNARRRVVRVSSLVLNARSSAPIWRLAIDGAMSSWRLTNEFCGEGVVDEAALNELADGLRQHNLDIRWAVETILRSELFFRDANIGTRVSDPVSFLLHPLRALECGRDPPSTLVLAEWVARMGQDLFHPPNVGGWTGGRRSGASQERRP